MDLLHDKEVTQLPYMEEKPLNTLHPYWLELGDRNSDTKVFYVMGSMSKYPCFLLVTSNQMSLKYGCPSKKSTP